MHNDGQYNEPDGEGEQLRGPLGGLVPPLTKAASFALVSCRRHVGGYILFNLAFAPSRSWSGRGVGRRPDGVVVPVPSPGVFCPA